MNQNNNLIEGFYEYKGVEDYNPTLQFVRNVYRVLTVQLSISLLLVYLFRGFMTPYTTSDEIVPVIIITIVAYLVILGTPLFIPHYRFSLRAFPHRYILFGLRTLFIPFFLAAYEDYSSAFLTLALAILLHMSLAIFCYFLKKEFVPVKAYLWVIAWAFIAMGIISLIRGYIPAIENFDPFIILFSVFKVQVYGIYLVYETGFLLNEPFYQINWNQYVFGAIILQLDYVGIVIGIRNIVLRCRGRR